MSARVDPIGLRRRIGYVFQSGGLFPHMSVAGNIGITPKLLGWPAGGNMPRGSTNCSTWCGSTARNIATACRTNCPAGSASASASRGRSPPKPRIVLMDEPFGALDPLNPRRARRRLSRACIAKLGLTTVMITHDMTEAILLADRVAVMRGGKLLAQGTPAELSNSDDAYVGELLRTPRRQAERLGDAAAAGWRGMSLFSDPRWSEALAHLPDYLGNHVRVSVTALALGLAVSLPLAIIARNRPLLRGALLGLASIVQTVPGLALLALFYPLLLALAALSLSWFGFGFSAFGFLPAVLALALYSMLPVLRNTITGLQGVDAAILEAAQGVGMTPRQSLFSVELPLALPVMMAGIRTAAVWVIGTATLSTPIGQTSLGNYIFAGLQTQNWVFVLFGCLAAAVLALAVDQLLALIENGHPQPQPASRPRSAASASRRWSRQRWCRRWRARRRAISSAPKPLPSNMCCRR